ncbi:hypothetical protein BST97_12465 [Nonlabens spongiae]|uniref:Addiction module component n=1 Tax=Nonlabens spongiae TaxID=331648 RepID=A0A1W6MMB7_9FLAO|nr:hypothetical protein [Nonlabens spongiae]ARN78740.1 hypothetical protein BST97_12465 [Nonlabens spongiae]
MKADLNSEKVSLIQWLAAVNDQDIIDRLIAIREQDSSVDVKGISSTERKSIEKGIAQAQNGRLNPNSKAKEIYGKWL